MYRKIRSRIKEYQRKMGKEILEKKKSSEKIEFKDIKKILFIRYDGKIGDYMVSSFIYREIKKQRPDIQIDVVGISKNEGLFLKNKNINNFYKLKKTKYRYLYPLAKRLKKEKYDILIDPTEVLKNKDLFFIREINSKINFGYAKESYKIFNKNIEENNEHITIIYKKILKELGFGDIDTTYDIPIDEEAEDNIEKFFKENNIEKGIAVNLFGAGKTRKFNLEKSLELLEYIKMKYSEYKIVLLDSPKDKILLDKILEVSKDTFYYKDSKSIFDSISIIKRSDIVVSPDTSIVHIGVGLGKKVIAFYSSDMKNFNKWGISSENEIVVYEHDINNLNFSTKD